MGIKKMHTCTQRLQVNSNTCIYIPSKAHTHARTHAHQSQEKFSPFFCHYPHLSRFSSFLLLCQYLNHTRDQFGFLCAISKTESSDKTYFGTLREVFKELKYSRDTNGFAYITRTKLQLSNERREEKRGGRWSEVKERGKKRDSEEMEEQRLQEVREREKCKIRKYSRPRI